MAQIYLFAVVFATASYGQSGQSAEEDEQVLEEVIIHKPGPAKAVNRKSGITREADAPETLDIVRSGFRTSTHVDDMVTTPPGSDGYKSRTADDKDDPRIERKKRSEEELKAKSKEEQ